MRVFDLEGVASSGCSVSQCYSQTCSGLGSHLGNIKDTAYAASGGAGQADPMRGFLQERLERNRNWKQPRICHLLGIQNLTPFPASLVLCGPGAALGAQCWCPEERARPRREACASLIMKENNERGKQRRAVVALLCDFGQLPCLLRASNPLCSVSDEVQMVNGFLEFVVCRREPRPLRASTLRPARPDLLRSPTHEAVSPRLGPLPPTCPQGPHLLLGSSIFSLECLRED